MPLTDTQVRTARYNPEGAGNRLSDGGRMYLQLDKSGAKYWRMNYRFAGKDKTLALGVYPDVSLAAARKNRDEVRARLAAGMDPTAVKRLISVQPDSQQAIRLKRLHWHGCKNVNPT
ncbi:hypothetical protein QF001_002276 [Paraburkholderia youngii]